MPDRDVPGEREPNSANDVNLDVQRRQRIGFDEAVLCGHKSLSQLTTILDQAATRRAPLLLTRLTQEQWAQLPAAHRKRLELDPVSSTAFFGKVSPPADAPRVAVITAGTSDVPVGREAVRTLAYYGEASLEINDVGVAGIHRLQERLDDFRDLPVIIAVAGMDAALPSVIGGLVSGMVIAVPTSIGYGVAEGGWTALRAMLVSCAPGVLVVNIDNGFGAGCAALRALQAFQRHGPGTGIK